MNAKQKANIHKQIFKLYNKIQYSQSKINEEMNMLYHMTVDLLCDINQKEQKNTRKTKK